MNEQEKGEHFLKLIDSQNNIQWSIISKLSLLISSQWNSAELKEQLDTLVKDHFKITQELNSLDKS